MGVFKVPDGKVQLHVYISQDLYKRLVESAPSVYGGKKLKGAISQMVEDALRIHLEQRTHTNSGKHFHPTSGESKSTGQPSRVTRHERTVQSIARAMVDLGYHQAISVRDLKAIIAKIAGGDKRTYEKYSGELASRGVLPKTKVTNIDWGDPLHDSRILEVSFDALQREAVKAAKLG